MLYVTLLFRFATPDNFEKYLMNNFLNLFKMQTNSLVKYNTPILVSVSNAKKAKNAGNKTTTQTEDILNSILPPRL
jgi:hypothetical protein